jgi:hypothetical protein
MIRERIIEIFDALDLTSKKMEELTGIDRWNRSFFAGVSSPGHPA